MLRSISDINAYSSVGGLTDIAGIAKPKTLSCKPGKKGAGGGLRRNATPCRPRGPQRNACSHALRGKHRSGTGPLDAGLHSTKSVHHLILDELVQPPLQASRPACGQRRGRGERLIRDPHTNTGLRYAAAGSRPRDSFRRRYNVTGVGWASVLTYLSTQRHHDPEVSPRPRRLCEQRMRSQGAAKL